jgi:hypothetical protein
MYLKPYRVQGYKELKTLTELADYYCALPVLSRTLDAAFLRSFVFVEEIKHSSCKMLILAAKLRNSVLFRESRMVPRSLGQGIVAKSERPKTKEDCQDRSARIVSQNCRGSGSNHPRNRIRRHHIQRKT